MTLPDTLPREFLEDVVAFTLMFRDSNIASMVHAEILQEEMKVRWPAPWMEWLRDEVGEVGDE